MAVSIQDLIKAQQPENGNIPSATPEEVDAILSKGRISVADFKKLTASGEAVKQVIQNNEKNLKKTIENSLAEKAIANTNTKELIQEIKNQTVTTVRAVKEGAERTVEAIDTPSSSKLEALSKEQSSKYMPGLNDYLQNNRTNSFSLGSFFDQDKLDSSKGLFASTIRKRISKTQYVKDRLSIDKANDPSMSALDIHQRKSDLGKEFDSDNKIRGQLKKVEQEIDRLKLNENISEADIGSLGHYKTRENLLSGLSSNQSKLSISNLDTNTTNDVIAASGLMGGTTSEEKEESFKIIGEQTGILKKIEENTRPIKQPTTPVSITNITNASPDESLIGDIDGPGSRSKTKVPGPVKPVKKGNIFSRNIKKLGGATKIAGVAGAGLVGYEVYQNWNDTNDKLKDGEITPDEADLSKIKSVGQGVGGIAGGLAGAEAGSMGGAAIGAVLGPVGALIGGALGGLAGGAVGFWGGGKLGDVASEKAAKWWKGPDNELEGAIDAKRVSPPSSDLASIVYNKSAENVVSPVTADGPKPVVINAPTTNNQTQIINQKSNPRNTESTQTQYNKSIYAPF